MKSEFLDEPYRLLFTAGTAFLLAGALLWLPLLWNGGSYPTQLHGELVFKGFVSCFVGGFLMTAIPRFSQTFSARAWEVVGFLSVTCAGFIESWIFVLQPVIIIAFVARRIPVRKRTPPASFIFVGLGLAAWLAGSVGTLIDAPPFDLWKSLSQEVFISAMILGVGARLVPGIMGHTEIVPGKEEAQSLKIPGSLAAAMLLFVFGTLYRGQVGAWAGALAVCIVGIFHWRCLRMPPKKNALNLSILACSWLIIGSYLARAIFWSGGIHILHGFYLNGVVLLSLLIAVRVIQSHGPQDERLEDSLFIYFTTVLIFMASLARVGILVMPGKTLFLLGLASVFLTLGVLFWSYRYMPYVLVFPEKKGDR